MLPDKMDENLKVDLMAGAAGGGVSVFVSHPLDTVKVKMQLYPASFKNMGVCLKQIFNRQGIRGLYCGTIPALTSTCAETAVMFGTYGQCQKIVASKLDVGTDITKLNYLQNAAAGGMASVLTSLVLCPTELVKIRMQADYGVNKKSAAKVIRETFKTDGFKGFLRGLSFTLARESIGNTVFFGTYEWCREFLKPKGQSKEGCSVFATMISGSVAGVANWVAVYPFDVIKSKLQSTTGKVSRKFIWEQIKEQGIRSLYNGLRPTLVKTIPTTGLMLVGVEYSKPWFKKLLCLTQSSNPPDNIKADKEVFSYCDFLSGWTAGIVSTCIGHPMETIRVVQQVKNVSPLPAFREIYRKHGIPGFYRGMMFPVLSSGIVNSVVFGVNGNTMRFIQTTFRDDITENDRSVRFCCNAESLHKYWHIDCFLSGCVAGVFSTLINIPVELVKTVLQASNISLFVTPDKKMGRNNPTRLIQEIYKKNGIRGLYRGGFVLLLRDVPSTGIYILSYEHICSLLRNYSDEKRKNDIFPWQIQLFAGGMAGIACWASVLPFDVIKTQRMLDSVDNPQCKSFWYCTKMIYKNGGIARFYQGFWVLSTRAFLVNSVAFFVYEFLLKACSNFNKMPSTSTHLTSLTIKTDDKYSKWN